MSCCARVRSFDHKNWNKGWVGDIFNKVVEELDVEVISMTRANFTQQTYDAYVVALNGGVCSCDSRACLRAASIADSS